MPLEPDILAAIQESVSAIIKPLADGLDKVNHDNSKLSQAIADISNNVAQKLSTIDPVAEYVEKLKSQQEEQPPATTSSPQSQPDGKEPSKLDKEIAKVRAEYQSRFDKLQQQLEARDAETQRLKEAERQTRMRTNVLSEMRELGTIRPNTEEDLLTLLERRGLIAEENDKLFIKTQNKYGEVANSPFKEILPQMLENDFAHFSIPRNGTGTDGQPGQRDAARTQKYDFASMSALEIHELCESDPNARGEFDRMLESLYR